MRYKSEKTKQQTQQVASWNIATFEISQLSSSKINAFLCKIEDHSEFLASIEYHGLAPVFYHTIASTDLIVAPSILQTLQGLCIKHRLRWDAFSLALKELHPALTNAGVEFALLKGASLAEQIYTKGEHRCMQDLDILIREDQSKIAKGVLQSLGYLFSAEHVGELKDHHHLPAATKEVDQHTIVIELHTQALSPDMCTPIHFDQLVEPLRCFNMLGYRWSTLGHVDSLAVLCKHTFSRDELIKLSGIVDLFRYVARYHDEVDWPNIQQHHGYILNTLRLCLCIVELPEKLPINMQNLIKNPGAGFCHRTQGIGYGMVPLRQLVDSNVSWPKKVTDLFCPSAWWMHNFYAVSPEQSLWRVQWMIHPFWVLRWLVKKKWFKLRV